MEEEEEREGGSGRGAKGGGSGHTLASLSPLVPAEEPVQLHGPPRLQPWPLAQGSFALLLQRLHRCARPVGLACPTGSFAPTGSPVCSRAGLWQEPSSVSFCLQIAARETPLHTHALQPWEPWSLPSRVSWAPPGGGE